MKMYVFSDKFSYAESTLYAKKKEIKGSAGYQFKRLEYPDVYIPDRSIAWPLSFLSEDSPQKVQLREAVDSYNAYIAKLEQIPGFLKYFIESDYCVSKTSIEERWSKDVADIVFSKEKYVFKPDLIILDDNLFDYTIPVSYSLPLDGKELVLPIGADGESYPVSHNDKQLIWNWTEIGHDFCFSIWELLGSPYCKEGNFIEDDDSDDDGIVRYSFDAYDQFRSDFTEPQLVRIFHMLEQTGYIKSFTIRPAKEDPRWRMFGKNDGSIDVALVDLKFKKNRLIMERIGILLWSKEDELNSHPYFLTNANNHQYLSDIPGQFGGHHKLKIYGRLDCKSALRAIEKGQYVKNRVFFIDENTAIRAGFRPCAKCMPEEYKVWKEKQMR